MKVLLIICSGVVGIFAALVAIEYFTTWETSWRQRLAFEIETPSGPAIGASVTEIRKTRKNGIIMRQIAFPEARGVKTRTSGEAVVVDLGEGRYLFALLPGMEDLAYRTFRSSEDEGLYETMRRIGGGTEDRTVAHEDLPLLVTFTDIDDPTTVAKVDPDDLAASFGLGVRLKRVTIEITDEPVTEGQVEKVLGWLDDYYNQRLDGNRFGTSEAELKFANSLSAGAFDTEKD